MQPLRGPREQSSVSITLFRSFFVIGSSSMCLELRRSESSSSSLPRKNLDRYLDLPAGSSSSSSPPYLLRLVLLLLASLLYRDSPKARRLGGELSSLRLNSLTSRWSLLDRDNPEDRDSKSSVSFLLESCILRSPISRIRLAMSLIPSWQVNLIRLVYSSLLVS